MTDTGVVCALPDRSATADIRKYQDPVVIRVRSSLASH